jgi:predicted  nucleic acid-binding Zn-ribbon protein
MGDWTAAYDPRVLAKEALINEIDAALDTYVDLVGGSTPLLQRIFAIDSEIAQRFANVDREIADQESEISVLSRRIRDLERRKGELESTLMGLRVEAQLYADGIATYRK